MKKTITLTICALTGLLFFSACNEVPADKKTSSKTETASRPISADSLIANWNHSWNQNDSIAISRMFTDHSVMLSGPSNLVGGESLMGKWINPHLPQVGNLQTQKIASGATEDMAYLSGSYTMDLTTNDSITGSTKGNFTIIWKKQENGLLKIEVMHLEAVE